MKLTIAVSLCYFSSCTENQLKRSPTKNLRFRGADDAPIEPDENQEYSRFLADYDVSHDGTNDKLLIDGQVYSSEPKSYDITTLKCD